MLYEGMDLHRLRVVDFDTCVSEKEVEKKYNAEHEERKQKESSSFGYKKDEIYQTGTEKRLSDHSSPPELSQNSLVDKMSQPGTSKICLGDTSTTTEISKQFSFMKHKSKSEIKIPSNSKPRRHDLKNNASIADLTKVFQDSAHSHQKKRPLNLFNRKSRVDQKVEVVKNKKEKNEEIHFLFARETPSFFKFRRKRAEKEEKETKTKHDSKLPNDIFGFHKNNRYIDPYLYQMSCCSCMNTDKLHSKKKKKGLYRKSKKPAPPSSAPMNCACKYHAMRILNSGGQGEAPSLYYNLNTQHPHQQKTHYKGDYDNKEITNRKRPNYMAKDKTVGVSPSSLSPITKYCCDARTGPSKPELVERSQRLQPGSREGSPAQQNVICGCYDKPYPKHSTPSPSTQNEPHAIAYKKKHENTEEKKNGVSNQHNRLFSGFVQNTGFRIKNLPSGKNCIKYAFFGLLIVVWSPCLLAVILAWVVMCPVKISNIIRTDRTKRSFPMMNSFMNRFRKKSSGCQYQQMCFDNCLPVSNRSFMTSVASWYSRAVGTIVNSFNAMISMLKLKNKSPPSAESSFMTSAHPNPRKRYTLFYAYNRGWMMKPSRRNNTQSCASSRIVQNMRCEFKPTFWRKSKCNEKCQTEIKLPCKQSCFKCPVHGTRYVPSYAKHNSSLAGDACTIFTNPEPGCVCNKYLKYSANRNSRNDKQVSSMFMPVASHRLRRQQVNILPILFHPTPDIATSSTVYQNNAADMSNKDYPKDHIGLRKNGTFPFGVAFNCPCGTKHPIITNLETFRSHKFGLAGKSLNMSTKYTPSLMVKGLQGRFAKYWPKHEASNTSKKSLGAHSPNGSTDIRKNMPEKSHYNPNYKTSRLQTHNTECELALKWINREPVTTDTKLPIDRKKRHIGNKNILTTISRSVITKPANTTNKVNYAHKSRVTKKHSTSINHNIALNCPCGAKHALSKKQAHKKYKSDKPLKVALKQPSPANTKASKKSDVALNCPCGAKHETSKQAHKKKSDKPLNSAKKQPSPAEIEASNKSDIALNCPCGAKHETSKQAHKKKSDKPLNSAKKQPSPVEIEASNKSDIALNCPCGAKHETSKQAHKTKSDKPLNSALKQPSPANTKASKKSDVALNCRCGAKNKTSKQDHKNKSDKPLNSALKQPSPADTEASNKSDIALNCPCGAKHSLSKQVQTYKSDKPLNSALEQPSPANTKASKKFDVPLKCHCGAKYETSKQDHKYKSDKPLNSALKQPSPADTEASNKSDIALNCPCGAKHALSKQVQTYKSDKPLNSALKQPSPADTEASNKSDIALNCPCGAKHALSKQVHKYKSDKPLHSALKQPSPADTKTSNKSDIALNCPCGAKLELSKQAHKYKSYKPLNAAQKQTSPARQASKAINKSDMAATRQSGGSPAIIRSSTQRDIALNCPCGHELSKQPYIYKSDKPLDSTQKQPSPADIQASKKADIAITCHCKERPLECTCKSKPDKTLVPIRKQPSPANLKSSTKRDIALNCPCGHELSKQPYIYKSDKPLDSSQKQPSPADIKANKKTDIAVTCHCKERPLECPCKSKPVKTLVPIRKQPSTANLKSSTKHDIALNCPCGHELSKQPYIYKSDKPLDSTQKQRSPANIKANDKADKDLNCQCGAKLDKNFIARKQPSTADFTTSTNRNVALNCPCCVKSSTADKDTLCIQKYVSTYDKDTMYPQKTSLKTTKKQSTDIDKASQCACKSVASVSFKSDLSKQSATPKKAVDCACGSDKVQSKSAAEHPIKHETTQCPCKSEASKTKDTVRLEQYASLKKAIDCACGSDKVQNKSATEHPMKHEASQCPCTSGASKTKETVRLEQSTSFKKAVDCACGSDKVQSKSMAKHPMKHEASQCPCKSEANKTKETVRLEQSASLKKAVDCACGSDKVQNKSATEHPMKHEASQCPCTSGASKTKETVRLEQSVLLKKAVDCACGSDRVQSKFAAAHPMKHEASQCPCKSEASKTKGTVCLEYASLRKGVDCACGSDKLQSKSAVKRASKPQSSQCSSSKAQFRRASEISFTSKQSRTNNIKCHSTYKTKIGKNGTQSKSLVSHKRTIYQETPHSYKTRFVNKALSKVKCTKTGSQITKLSRRESVIPKSLGFSPSQIFVPHTDCTCSVQNVKKSQHSQESFKNKLLEYRKNQQQQTSKRKTSVIPSASFNSHIDPDPASSSASDQTDIDVPRDISRQSSKQSHKTTECSCSVNQPSSQLQSSVKSRQSSSISRLVKKLHSKLFSRNISQQSRISNKEPSPNNSSLRNSSCSVVCKHIDKELNISHQNHSRRSSQQSNKSQSSTFSSYLSHTKCRCPVNKTFYASIHRKHIQVKESNKNGFRCIHMSKATQYPCLPVYSSSTIHKTSSKLSSAKTSRYKCKTLLVDKPQSGFSKLSIGRLSKTSRCSTLQSHYTEYLRQIELIKKSEQNQSCSRQYLPSQRHTACQDTSLVQKLLNNYQQSLEKLDSQHLLGHQTIFTQHSSSVDNSTTNRKSQYLQNHEFPTYKRSSFFNRPQSKPLTDKLRSITDSISIHSRKNKQEKLSPKKVQTAPIIPGKCACLSEKLHQLSEKLSQYSLRKSTLGNDSQNPQHVQIQQPKVSKQSRHYSCQKTPLVDCQYLTSDPVTPLSVGTQIPPQFSSHAPSKQSKICKQSHCSSQPTSLTDTQELSSQTPSKLLYNGDPSETLKESHKYSSQITPLTDNQKLTSDSASPLPIITTKMERPFRKQSDKKPPLPSHTKYSKRSDVNQLQISDCRSQPHPSRKKLEPRALCGFPYHILCQQSDPSRLISGKCTCLISNHGNTQEVIPPQMPLRLKNLKKSPLVSGTSYIKKNRISRVNVFNNSNIIGLTEKRLGRQHVIIQRSELLQNPQIKFPQYPQNLFNVQNPQNRQSPQNPKISHSPNKLQNIKAAQPDKTSTVPLKTAPVDKPPPGLLQRNTSRHGRKSFADGGGQQYPDFNRVSMRYPGHKSPSTKLYYPPPARGAPPPLNYARRPCYVDPANKCGPRSCYDEYALRRAYKRRPLRYTPPRKKLPNLAKLKKKAADAKKQKEQAPGNKLTQFYRCIRDTVYKIEKEAWPIDVTCRPLWIHALKRRPCFWIYKSWPGIYPIFLNLYKFQKNICQIFMYAIAICFWCPLLFCVYLCFDSICQGE